MDTQTPPTPLLAWDAPITPTHVRSTRWYVIGSVLILAFVVYSVIVGDWSFAISLLLLGGIYFLLRNTPVVLHHMSLEEHGFSLDGTFTRWEDCTDFWIVHVPTHKELHIEKTKTRWGTREVVIQTGTLAPEELRAVLSQHLHERSDQKERFTDAVIRILKL